jgi:hypothetical protein
MLAVIPCEGVMASQRAETNMQLALCTVRHHARVSRTANVAAVNPTLIWRLRKLKIKEDAHESHLPSAPSIDWKNWPKTTNALQSCCSCMAS